MSESTLVVKELGAQGDGVAEVGGEPVFIPFTLPGETVVASAAPPAIKLEFFRNARRESAPGTGLAACSGADC